MEASKTFTDVTALKKETSAAALDYSPVGTMIWNADDKLLYQNRFSYAFQEQTFGSAFELGQVQRSSQLVKMVILRSTIPK